jgi:hypothetical protein
MLATARIRPPRLYVTVQSRELNEPSMSIVPQVSKARVVHFCWHLCYKSSRILGQLTVLRPDELLFQHEE